MHQRPKQSPNHVRKMKHSQPMLASSQDGEGPNGRVINTSLYAKYMKSTL